MKMTAKLAKEIERSSTTATTLWDYSNMLGVNLYISMEGDLIDWSKFNSKS